MKLLFDLDGTLLVDNIYRPQAAALCWAAWEVFGVVGEAVPIDWVGKTDLQIAREMAEHGGHEFDGHREEYTASFLSRFEATAPGDISELVRPGAFDILWRCRDLGWETGVVTGNLRPVAVAKLRRSGLAPLLDLDASGFGSDSELRTEIVAVAGGDAMVGDTHRDVEAAKRNGLLAVALVTPRHAREELETADVIVDTLEEVEAAVASRVRVA